MGDPGTTAAASRGSAVPDALWQALTAPRIVADILSPNVDHGRYPARGTVGHRVDVVARIFCDGHPQLAAELLVKAPGEDWQRLPLREADNDRWTAHWTPARCGVHRYTIEAWIDDWAGYRRDLRKLVAAGRVTDADRREGLDRVRALVVESGDETLQALLQRLETGNADAQLQALLDDTTTALLMPHLPRRFLSRHTPVLSLDVERERAGFASWYELFPRSQAHEADRHGTFDDVISRLPMIAAMGFDVLYMPPIHPIGTTKRKGPNNSLQAAPDDPGSPYAIGSAEGGHDAIHPQLGGIDAFRRLRDAAAGYGIELALDFAIQCSPDHPWLREHPGWFNWRADGSLRCAENPPKKYEDIVNVDFYAEGAMPSLWLAWRDVIEFWIGEGVRSFRVDNPHTKPLPFWEWLIADIRLRHPETTFLSEAFTRPAMMYRLAKIGFSQSYTYFTWRNGKDELREYLCELTQEAPRDFFRPHFFVNTPDINPVFLQASGRPGFLIRAALATTLSGLWGLYSGFELCEAAALPGREEYLDSEKYQLKPRDWTAPGHIITEITRLNHLRREYRALQSHHGVSFVDSDNPQVLCYCKRAPGDHTMLLVAVSLDPHAVQETHFSLPLDALGVSETAVLGAEELMSGQQMHWRGPRQHWRFIPQELPFAIWRLDADATAAEGR